MFTVPHISSENDKRKFKRAHLIYYLRVFNRDTGQLIGHLVDITGEGMMLVSEAPIEVGEQLDLRMMLPTAIFNETQLDFKAESLWCSNDINPEFYDAGFRLLDIGDKNKALISRLIDEYGFAS
jgi:hypothetical protein